MFYLIFAGLGLALATNVQVGAKLYSPDNPAVLRSSRQGSTEAYYGLHRKHNQDMVIASPRYWNKSKYHHDLVAEANGPTNKISAANLHTARQGHIGEFPPITTRGKRL